VYLKENDVNFIEIDITRDRAAAQRVRGWANGNETTPTIDVKGSIIVTYDKARLAKELGIA
jgi:glutaredoxin